MEEETRLSSAGVLAGGLLLPLGGEGRRSQPPGTHRPRHQAEEQIGKVKPSREKDTPPPVESTDARRRPKKRRVKRVFPGFTRRLGRMGLRLRGTGSAAYRFSR